MAIRAQFSNTKTGAVFPTAHHVLLPPVMRADSRQVTLTLLVYATQADYAAGKEPEHKYVRTFETAIFTALMDDFKNRVEPALIQRFFPAGVRVPD